MAKKVPWTAGEQRVLTESVGYFSASRMQTRMGKHHPETAQRTMAALYARARTLWGKGGLTRGAYSLNELVQESGYSLTAIRRAQVALNHAYRRLSPTGPYLVTYDQREDIYAWLKNDYWSKSLRRYTCVECDQKQRPHKAFGLCTRCYFQHRRLLQRLGIPQTPSQQRAWLQQRPNHTPQQLDWLNRGLALTRAILTALGVACSP